MRDMLLTLARAGKTLIVTSHILPELSRICDQVAIITHGKLRALGTVDEIMRQVQQERMIEVQLASADQIERAVRVITPLVEENAGVTGSPAEAIVRFRTKKPEDAMGQLLARLVVAEVRVNEFREVQSDLEDTFLSITRSTTPSGDREAAPPKARPERQKTKRAE
jgi:ABC-2 type transport system ATP-binding protein